MSRYQYFLILIPILLTACSKEPEANFKVTWMTNPYPPAKIYFQNLSVDADSYSWDFGDGKSSSEVSPTHTYYTGGDYEVTLTAKNGRKSNVCSETIIINTEGTSVRVFNSSSHDIKYLIIHLAGGDSDPEDHQIDELKMNAYSELFHTSHPNVGISFYMEDQLYVSDGYMPLFKDEENTIVIQEDEIEIWVFNTTEKIHEEYYKK